MPKQADESDLYLALADYCLRIDCRLMALEVLFAETFYKNSEQREAFHADVTAMFQLFYEARLKQGEAMEPLTVKRLRALARKRKKR
jgi:hypothetical protein